MLWVAGWEAQLCPCWREGLAPWCLFGGVAVLTESPPLSVGQVLLRRGQLKWVGAEWGPLGGLFALPILMKRNTGGVHKCQVS